MLTDRQLLIFQVIVDDFIRYAQPVGSRALSKKEEINLSSATIRNEMADLEELGFLEKMHTSSGRIPSEKGYRFYVDHLLSPQKLNNRDIKMLKSIFTERIYELEHIFQRVAEILSELTNYTAIALGPEARENRLKKIQIIPLNKKTAVAVIVTDTGHVENRLFYLPPNVDASDIEKTVNILNERLANVPLVDLTDKIYSEVAELLERHINNYDMMLNRIAETLKVPMTAKLYFGGKTNILRQPEFHDFSKIKMLMEMIEQEKDIYDIVREKSEGIRVRIGKENKISAMEHCSLITATYSTGTDKFGTIAILGPTRMEYSRVISLLEYISNNLTNELAKLYQNN